METMDNEKFLFDTYKSIPSYKIKYFGRFFTCFKIDMLTKSILFNKSWVNSSSKSDLPPDFHNDRHKIMLEVMRIDDCVNISNNKNIDNSFAKSNKLACKIFGNNYKENVDGFFFSVPNTNDSNEFNFKGYINNFERVILKHSFKVNSYRKNYPKCKTTVFLICDESNNYVQVSNKKDLEKENEENFELKDAKAHFCYCDSQFIEIIKKCEADFVIWWGYHKGISINNKRINYPQVCIYDVKYFKEKGHVYNHELMFKIKEKYLNKNKEHGNFIAAVRK